jgi:hypothetical protein
VRPWGRRTSQGTLPESARSMGERGPMTAISTVAVVEACVALLLCDVSLLSTTGVSTCGATGKPRAELGDVVRTPVVVRPSKRSYLGAKGPSDDGCAEPRLNTSGVVPAGITAPRGVRSRGRGLSKGEYEGLDT